MEDVKGELGSLGRYDGQHNQNNGVRTDQEGTSGPHSLDPEAVRIRAERANFIEKTTYQITDLLTIISGRIQILSDKVPDVSREELQSIRKVIANRVELNKRLFLAVQACRREIGV